LAGDSLTTRDTITLVFLWIAVLSWGIWIGGTIYQMMVIVPMWSASPPESLRGFLTRTDFLHHVVKFFGPRWMPLRVLSVWGALFCGWNLRAHRPFLIAAPFCVTIGVVFTMAYIYPINAILFDQVGGNLSDEEIRAMLRQWILADRARLFLISVGYLALLRAFSMAMPASGR
jgi:uncharacterized membrane protein